MTTLITSLLALVLPLADQDGSCPAKTAGVPACPESREAECLDLAAWYQRLFSDELPRVAKPRNAVMTQRLTLPEAIRIGLEHSEAIEIVATVDETAKEPDPALKGCSACLERERPLRAIITPADSAGDILGFKSEVMSYIRSVEQHYWNLVALDARLEAISTAVERAGDVLDHERKALKAGNGSEADEAEAAERLEQFRLDLLVETAERNAAEHQLRQLLGLPFRSADSIVPITEAVESFALPDWDESRRTMLSHQPDIAEQRSIVHASAMRLLESHGPGRLMLALDPLPDSDRAGDSPDVSEARRIFVKQRDYLKQIVDQSTNSLARSISEVESSYEQFHSAQRLHDAAVRRLEAQRVEYKEGRGTLERYLDAIRQAAHASLQVARLRSVYNCALVACEEVKGTLLESRGIRVAAPARPGASGRPDAVVQSADDPEVVQTGGATDEPTVAPVPVGIAGEPGSVSPSRTTIKFDITIGRQKPLQLRGSVSIVPGKDNVGP